MAERTLRGKTAIVGVERTPLTTPFGREPVGAWIVSRRPTQRDVNGDGRTDVLVPMGWFEAPADPRAGNWIWHPDFEALSSWMFDFYLRRRMKGESEQQVLQALTNALKHPEEFLAKHPGEG